MAGVKVVVLARQELGVVRRSRRFLRLGATEQVVMMAIDGHDVGSGARADAGRRISVRHLLHAFRVRSGIGLRELNVIYIKDSY